jgi:hypothetical protein
MNQAVVTRLSPQKPMFDPRPVHVGFVLDQVHWNRIFSKYFSSPLSLSIPPMLHTHSLIYHQYTKSWRLTASLNNALKEIHLTPCEHLNEPLLHVVTISMGITALSTLPLLGNLSREGKRNNISISNGCLKLWRERLNPFTCKLQAKMKYKIKSKNYMQDFFTVKYGLNCMSQAPSDTPTQWG